MSQNLNLSFAGLYTAPSDYAGGPPGACTVANNVECRYKNLAESRRGFSYLADSSLAGVTHDRLTNFEVTTINALISRGSDGTLRYYNPSSVPTPWATIPGNFSTSLTNPDDNNSRSRFIRAGGNLYCTSGEGLRSLASGTNSNLLRAGVPKGLDLEATVSLNATGFFSNNTVLVTTGNAASGSTTINNITGDTTKLVAGLYVSGTDIPAGTTIVSVADSSPVLVTTGNTSAGSTTISSLAVTGGLAIGQLVSGTGIQSGSTISSISGSSVVLNKAPYETGTGVTITFNTSVALTLSNAATGTNSSESLTFYSGSQVAYRILYGRIETDLNGNQVTRLGAASPLITATNILSGLANVAVTATLPKNSTELISFAQLYRSVQTTSASIAPLDQYQLVNEYQLTNTDFTNRTITITDSLSQSNAGAALYSGTDQEGPTQENSPPPMCWDMTIFRNFILYANITRPTTLSFTILAAGPSNGVQIGDTITIAGNFGGVAYSEVYTGASSENAASRQFKVVTSGTPSQNIIDTANSLVRVINYDNALPVHALYVSPSDALPGQILLEADNASYETFTTTASAHTSAYDPALTGVVSEVNTINNGIAISKVQELEAVPVGNLVYAGDQSSDILRVVALRDYVFVIKTDGVYRLLGLDPSSIVVNDFDRTVRVIGPDTAVRLNSICYMLSNQGVVAMSDAGVSGKSVPIDDQIQAMIAEFQTNLNQYSFGIGYEADRKYILSTPSNSASAFTENQFCFNYLTNVWTTWDRNLRAGYINSKDKLLYISRADSNGENGVSSERKNGDYTDYIDETYSVNIVSFTLKSVVLTDATGVQPGDVLYQSSVNFSLITAVNTLTNTLTVTDTLTWTLGAATIEPAIQCDISWKQVFADNPAFARQYSEGIILFKNTRFATATLFFETDYSNSDSSCTISGAGITPNLWGRFAWGSPPWGALQLPQNIRFLLPQDKQLGSYVIPSLEIRQAYSNWLLQGLAISYRNISQEVGFFS